MGAGKIEDNRLSRSVAVREPYEGLTPLGIGRVGALDDKARIYDGIAAAPNRWVELACEEAKVSVERGGGPFGAVLLQIDDETNEVIRYWREHNHVTEFRDPTAHAEISAIRSACGELGVHDLGEIGRDEAALPQRGETSHCEMYCSCEPCPMCYSAIAWARIPVLVFSATRFDAAQPGVGFSDEEIYDELERGYGDRSIRVYQAASVGALEAFELWKKSDNMRF